MNKEGHIGVVSNTGAPISKNGGEPILKRSQTNNHSVATSVQSKTNGEASIIASLKANDQYTDNGGSTSKLFY
jgi:hypothetical protein